MNKAAGTPAEIGGGRAAREWSLSIPEGGTLVGLEIWRKRLQQFQRLQMSETYGDSGLLVILSRKDAVHHGIHGEHGKGTGW